MNPMIARRRYVSRQFLVCAVALSLSTGALVGSAFSQPPTPRAGQKEGAPPQQQAKQENNTPPAPTASERGSAASPIVVAKTKGDADADEQERHENSINRWTTTGLAGITLVVLYLQWGVMDTQNRIMEGQSAIMKRQRRTAAKQARHMEEGLIETRRAADAAKASADFATNALNMAHRPQLVIRTVVVAGIDDNGRVGTSLTDGYILVTNIGVLPATILKVYTEWLFAESLPIENPALNAMDNSTVPVAMPPAAFVKIPVPDREIEAHEFRVINNGIEGIANSFGERGGYLFLIGYIKYTDAIGLRRSYFCRRYDTGAHYFAEEDHPSYSYED